MRVRERGVETEVSVAARRGRVRRRSDVREIGVQHAVSGCAQPVALVVALRDGGRQLAQTVLQPPQLPTQSDE